MLNYAFFVLELSLVLLRLSVMMSPFNSAWAQLKNRAPSSQILTPLMPFSDLLLL